MLSGPALNSVILEPWVESSAPVMESESSLLSDSLRPWRFGVLLSPYYRIFFQLFTQLWSCPCWVSDTGHGAFRAKTTRSCSLQEGPQEIWPLPLHITTRSALKLFRLLSVLTYQQKKRIVWDHWKHGKIWHVQIKLYQFEMWFNVTSACSMSVKITVFWKFKTTKK